MANRPAPRRAEPEGLLSKLLGLIGLQTKAAASTLETYSLTDPAFAARFANQSAAGKAVTEDSADRVSTAWSCRRILAETIGAIPWGLYHKDAKDNAQPADDHWLSDVLVDSPNAEMTDVEFREAMVHNLTGNGNAYALIERAASRVTSLTPMDADCTRPLQKGPGVQTQLAIPDGTVFFRTQDRGKTVDLPREKVFHVKGFGRNGIVGLSPLGAAREAMGLALATDEFGARFFSQGGMPSGTVSVPNWLTEEQRDIARENLQQMLGGLGNAHRFALFEGGMKPEAWGAMPLEDMQFILLRKFSVLEICRFYRVPPHMVADLERATFSNIEHLSTEFVQYTLLPYFVRFEAAVKKWLLPASDRKNVLLKFNPEGLLRGDSAARAAFYASALQNGYMNRNEVRAKENLNNVQGLDEYTVQAAMVPVDRLGDIADAQIEANSGTADASSSAGSADAATTDARSKALAEGRADLAALGALAEAMRRLAQMQEKMTLGLHESFRKVVSILGGLAEDQSSGLKRVQRDLVEGLEAIANQEHELVLDSKGEPIGRRPKQAVQLRRIK